MASTAADTTIPDMHIVIPGALPPASIASELARVLPQHGPYLCSLFETLHDRVVPLHPAETGCTPTECAMLEQHGHESDSGVRPVQRLAAFHAGVTDTTETAWVAQLCSLSVGTEHVTLALPEQVDICGQEASTLMQDVLEQAPPTGFRLEPINSPTVQHAWRVRFDTPVELATSISPKAVSALGVTDWWPQGPTLQGWRKWLNEVQMVWHDHPVNADRVERGLPPINSLWLYGGGSGWQPTPPHHGALMFQQLEQAHAQADWSEWIRCLPALDDALKQCQQIEQLTLLGDARMVVLKPGRRNWWQSLLGARKQLWNQWWNPQA